jgi:hypothetical protein
MTEDTKGAGSELPKSLPAHMVACAISAAGDVDRAVAELNANGFSKDSVTVVQGAEGAAALRNRGSAGGRVNVVITRFIEYSGGIDDFTRHAIELAEQGDHILLVVLTSGDGDEVEQVWQILKRNHGREGVVVGTHGLNYELTT